MNSDVNLKIDYWTPLKKIDTSIDLNKFTVKIDYRIRYEWSITRYDLKNRPLYSISNFNFTFLNQINSDKLIKLYTLLKIYSWNITTKIDHQLDFKYQFLYWLENLIFEHNKTIDYRTQSWSYNIKRDKETNDGSMSIIKINYWTWFGKSIISIQLIFKLDCIRRLLVSTWKINHPTPLRKSITEELDSTSNYRFFNRFKKKKKINTEWKIDYRTSYFEQLCELHSPNQIHIVYTTNNLTICRSFPKLTEGGAF